MAIEKITAPNHPYPRLAAAHLAIRNASSLIGYALGAERERGRDDLADTLFIADEKLVEALDALDSLDDQLNVEAKAVQP